MSKNNSVVLLGFHKDDIRHYGEFSRGIMMEPGCAFPAPVATRKDMFY